MTSQGEFPFDWHHCSAYWGGVQACRGRRAVAGGGWWRHGSGACALSTCPLTFPARACGAWPQLPPRPSSAAPAALLAASCLTLLGTRTTMLPSWWTATSTCQKCRHVACTDCPSLACAPPPAATFPCSEDSPPLPFSCSLHPSPTLLPSNLAGGAGRAAGQPVRGLLACGGRGARGGCDEEREAAAARPAGSLPPAALPRWAFERAAAVCALRRVQLVAAAARCAGRSAPCVCRTSNCHT